MMHSFLDFLIKKGLLNHDVAMQILNDAKETNMGLIASTARLSGLSETRIARNVAEFYGLPRFNYNQFRVDQLATELVSGIVSVRVGVLPYAFGPKEELHVVCYDPELTRGLLDEVERVISGPIFLGVGPMSAVRELAAFVHYGRSFSDGFGEQVCSIVRDEDTGRFKPLPKDVAHATSKIQNYQNGGNEEVDLAVLDQAFQPEDNELAIPIPSEEAVDKQIRHIAELNEGSTAFEWDEEDTVVRKIAVRDESLKNFFYRTITSRMEAPDVVARRRILLEPKRGEGLNHKTVSPPPPPTSRVPTRTSIAIPIQKTQFAPLATTPPPNTKNDFHRHAWEHKTPSRVIEAEPQENDSTVILQLTQQASRINELERRLAEMIGTVDRLQRQMKALLLTMREAGIAAKGGDS